MAPMIKPAAPQMFQHTKLQGVAVPVLLLLAGVLTLRSVSPGFAAPGLRGAQPEGRSSYAVAGAAAGQVPGGREAASSMGSVNWVIGLAALGGATMASRRQLRRGRPQTACEAVGLLYATQTGNTEAVAGYLAAEAGVEPADIGDYGAEDLAEFDGLIVGCPTWNTDADEYRSGTAWDDLIDDIKGADLSGKPVAVFGCGDSEGYADNFCDGIEELHETFKAAGAKMVGYVDASAYNHAASKSVRDGKFLGCPFDEDNQGDLSAGRAREWVAQLKSEGMPL